MIRKQKSGQALVEMALVLPIFLMILCAIYDFGCAFHIWNSLNLQCTEAARAGAKRKIFLAMGAYGSKTHGSTGDVLAAFSKHQSPMLLPGFLATPPTIVGVGVPNQDTVRVSSRYRYVPLTPLASLFLGGPSGIELNASAEAKKE
ncbi:MAG: pilus assembly protein [Candidatus Riflebacteria bacterium]|nr:pilus assembly protein [Candidatus Riflebacteria bacterium]